MVGNVNRDRRGWSVGYPNAIPNHVCSKLPETGLSWLTTHSPRISLYV